MAHRIAKKQHQQRTQQPQYQQPAQNLPQSQPANYYNNQPQSTSTSQSRLPRPILPSVDSIYTHDKTSYRHQKLAFPPAQSLFISNNNYDAGPQFLRPTSAYTFSTPKKSQFPLGVWVTPFASQRVHKIKVNSPLRCSRCKAYVNGYFRFDGTKTTAICNICGINFGIDTANTDPNNLNSTQIATQGIIDYVVKDKIFIKKRTDIIKLIIAIQIHNFMLQSNAFNTIIDSTRASLQNTQFQKNIRIGIVIFNGQGVTYLKMSNRQQGTYKQKHPKRYTVKYNAQGLCCPLSDKQMLFDPTTEKQQLEYLLDCILLIAEQQHKNSKYITQGANYAVVLRSLMQNFDQEVGRIILFSHTVPRAGPLAIRPRNQQDNKNPLKPLTMDYYQLSKQLVKARIGIDMYMICKQSLSTQQLATTHFLATHTGGNIHYYSPYLAQNHAQNLYYNVYGQLSRKCVYDVNFTARFSNGLNVSSFGIGDGIHEVRDISLGCFDSCNSVIVTYEQEEKIEENSAAFVQFAIMFTNGSGQRIIRILNYRFMVTNKIQQIHQACDYLAVANVLLRQTAHKMLRGDPIKVRDDLINRMVGIVAEYVQDGGNKIKSNNMFMAHQNLSAAFAYIHSFINSRIFLNHIKIPNDFRVMEAIRVNMGSFFAFANYFYPKLFSLGMEIYQASPVPGDLIEGEDFIEQSVVLPPNLPLTAQSASREGVYLSWSSDYLLILVQPDASSELLIEIFGTDNWDSIEEMNALPELETAHNIRINMIIQELRNRTSRNNGIFLPLLVRTAKKKGPYFDLVSNVMKEDILQCKYYSFMDAIHRNVQLRLK